MSGTLKGIKSTRIKSMTHTAYNTIKNSIISNELKPGDYLSESMIAQSLGMSRTPVREALSVLASEGLIEIHNGVGIFVKHITFKEIYEVFEVRAALECKALTTSLDNISDEEILQIEQEWLHLREKNENGEKIDLDTIIEYDSRLHSLIVDKCNNTYLKNIISSIRESITRYQRLSAKALGNERETINQHIQIINLLKEKDIKKIAPALEAHIKNAAEYIIRDHSN